jgi:predicted anti-sigma-YlaC factor YlaD
MTTTRTAACERVLGRLERLLDGELASLEAARDEGHLEACGACRAERDRQARVLDLLREPRTDLEFALEGLGARLADARPPRRALRLLRGSVPQAVLTAAAGLLALVAIELFDVGGEIELRRPEVSGVEQVSSVWFQKLESLLGAE